MILELIEQISKKATEEKLDFLLIGGHALAQHGYVRVTEDVDFLGREAHRLSWHTLFVEQGYKVFSETSTFVQYSSHDTDRPGVDIMFVEDATWEKLRNDAVTKAAGNTKLLVPSAKHLVALKLFAATNPKRRDADRDWIDIHQLVRICRLDPADAVFAELVRRYGGENALERIRALWQLEFGQQR